MAELEAEDYLEEESLPVSQLSIIHVPTRVATRFLRVPSIHGHHAFVILEDVVRMHLPRIFQGYTIKNCQALRVTRDSDLPMDEDPFEDLMKTVEEHLRSRRRGAAVRLQYENGPQPDPPGHAHRGAGAGPRGPLPHRRLHGLLGPDAALRPAGPAPPQGPGHAARAGAPDRSRRPRSSMPSPRTTSCCTTPSRASTTAWCASCARPRRIPRSWPSR